MTELELKAGDPVAIYNESGSTQASVYPTTTAKWKQPFHAVRQPRWRAGQRGIAGASTT